MHRRKRGNGVYVETVVGGVTVNAIVGRRMIVAGLIVIVVMTMIGRFMSCILGDHVEDGARVVPLGHANVSSGPRKGQVTDESAHG